MVRRLDGEVERRRWGDLQRFAEICKEPATRKCRRFDGWTDSKIDDLDV
jgi:hypothetical protein